MISPKREWRRFKSQEEKIEILKELKLVNSLEHYNIKKGQSHNALQDVLDLLELLKVVKPKRWSALSVSSSNSKNENKDDKSKSLSKVNSFRNFAKAKQLGIEIITEDEFWDIINKETGVK